MADTGAGLGGGGRAKGTRDYALQLQDTAWQVQAQERARTGLRMSSRAGKAWRAVHAGVGLGSLGVPRD